MKISSVHNEKVKRWMKYHQKKYRDQDAMFLVEGEHLIEEAYQAGCLATLLVREGHKLLVSGAHQTYEVCDAIMERLSKNVSKVDYIGVCRKLQVATAKQGRSVILDGVQDPGNVGTIIRSAYSFGFDIVYLGENCVDVYNEKVIRSTQGALFHIPVVVCDSIACIQNLQARGICVVATALQDSMPLKSLQAVEQMAFVFGNEGSGVSKECLQQSDVIVRIEMNHFESLNVAVAASICMYTFQK